jgi:hypothetical protein
MAIPAVGLNGVRQTVNTNISPTQKLWNLRSGLNVAALNCLRAEHAMLVDNYSTFLKRHSRELGRANRDLINEYRQQHGRSSRDVQDTYMTQVYNYFALPPALADFCDVALVLSNEIVALEAGSLATYSDGALARMEAVFENFYSSYEQYRVNVAAWDARYGPNRGFATVQYGPATTTGANLGATYPAPKPAPAPTGPVGGVTPDTAPIVTTYTPPSSAAVSQTAEPTIVGVAPGATAPDPIDELIGSTVPTPAPATDVAEAEQSGAIVQAQAMPQFVSNPVVQDNAATPEG